jgi:membrane fusion protein, multidrug efflux system
MTRRVVIVAGIVVALALLGYGGYAWYHASRHVTTDDAYVEGPIAAISAKVAGQVVELLVRDNQAVQQGDVLLRIDPRDHRLRVEQARSAVGIAESRHRAAVERVALGREVAQGQRTQARASILSAESTQQAAREAVESSRATVAARRAALDSLRAELDRTRALAERSELDLKRATELVAKELISRQDLDHASSDAKVAAAQVATAEQRVMQAERDLAAVEADLKGRESGSEPNQVGLRMADARAVDARARQIQADAMLQDVRVREAERELAAAQLREARANLAMAELNLEHTEVRAPIAGVVSKKSVELGHVVAVGQPLLAVVPLRDVWVIANFKETQLTRVRPGMPVRVEIDTFPDHVFTGTVESISAGTGSRFSLLPPENATGNWVKVVQRVPVKITLNPEEFGNPIVLRAGMSAFVTIRVR